MASHYGTHDQIDDGPVGGDGPFSSPVAVQRRFPIGPLTLILLAEEDWAAERRGDAVTLIEQAFRDLDAAALNPLALIGFAESAQAAGMTDMAQRFLEQALLAQDLSIPERNIPVSLEGNLQPGINESAECAHPLVRLAQPTERAF
jgi:hypothetical protein